MKKTSLLLCAAILLSLFTFTSCTRIKTAEQLFDRMDKAMADLDWYELELDMDMTFFTMGKQFDATAKASRIESSEKSEEYFYYESTTVNVTCAELNVEQTTETVSAYQDGQMFFLNTQGEEEKEEGQKVRSSITKSDFIAYKKEKSQTTDLIADAKDCENAEFTQNKNKSWTVECSGFSKESMEDFFKSSFDIKDMLGAELKDVHLTLELDKKFVMNEGEIEFIFETAEDAEQTPRLKATFECKSINEEPDSDLIDADDYREVTDARLFSEVDDLIEEAFSKESASFELEIDQRVTSGRQTNRNNETDIVKYVTDDDGFRYYITASKDGQEVELTYENGYLSNGSSSARQTQAEAKQFIQALLNSACYDKNKVVDIRKVKNAYTVTIEDPDLSKFALSPYKPKYDKKELTIVYTVNDEGELIKIEGKLSFNASLTVSGQSQGISVEEKTTLTYKKYAD